MNHDALIRRAAARARTRPEYLGWVLARYEDIEQMREEELRRQLRVSEVDWPRLQLCLRPRLDPFLADVTTISEAFGLSRSALAAVVRRVDAVEVVQAREQPGAAGSLLAARTRKQKPPPQKKAPSDE